MVLFRNFFKLYQQNGDALDLVGVIAISSYPEEAFVDDLDTLHDEGFFIRPTTFGAYMEYNVLSDIGHTADYVDNEVENINC